MEYVNVDEALNESEVVEQSSKDRSPEIETVQKYTFDEDRYVIDRPSRLKDIMSLEALELQPILRDSESVEVADAERGIRENAIYNEGVKYGAQSALYYALDQFSSLVRDNDFLLSSSFNFQPLTMFNGRVQPPVVRESKNTLLKENDTTFRTVQQSYTISQQAKVIYTPTSYHQYLKITPIKPQLPNPEVMPRNGSERAAWAEGVARGWSKGVEQAKNILLDKIRRMESDYVGMVRYHLMQKSGVVSEPIASNLNMGVSTDGSHINIGEVKFKVSILPEFNSDVETWKALPRIESFIDYEDE